MRYTLSLFVSLLLCAMLVASLAVAEEAPSASVRMSTLSAVRNAPGQVFLAKRGLQPDANGRYRMQLQTELATTPSASTVSDLMESTDPAETDFHPTPFKTSATLNCGNDKIISAAGTLVLSAGDAAGTIFAPVPGLSSLVVDTIRFGVFDFGASYPGTMTVDFWESVGPDEWEFVVGGDLPIIADPGLSGTLYEVDLAALELITGNEMMVLLYDANPGAGLILPAGDSSQTCFNGSDFCSVLLPAANPSLFLYGVTDAIACPGATGNIQLFDVVVEVDYFLDSPTDAPSRSAGFALHDAHPNPFNPRTSIRYSIPVASPVKLQIYDLAGRLVRTLAEEPRAAGEYIVHWDGRATDGASVASGVYLYRLETPAFEQTKRMVLLK